MNAHYAYRLLWSTEDSEYVGLCAEFPSLSWLVPGPDRRWPAFVASCMTAL